jgi:hypothetical protein
VPEPESDGAIEIEPLRTIVKELKQTISVERRPIGPEWGMTLEGHKMTVAGDFIASLQDEQKKGNVSSETEQHLKHEFRKIGRDARGPILSAAVNAEIERLERQAATLRRLRDILLRVA